MDRASPPVVGTVEWVDLGDISTGPGVGEVLGGATPQAGRSRRLSAAVGVLVAVVVLGLWAKDLGGPPAAAKPAGSEHPADPAPVRPNVEQGWRSGPAGPPPTVTRVREHLLGVRAGWELFGRGPGAVVRLEPAAGRLTVTKVPALQSSGPVSFLVGADRAIVRPLDDVAGYAVPDGRPSRVLHRTLSSGGLLLPGPDPQHVWFDTGDERRTGMLLLGLDGTPTGQQLIVPSRAIGPLVSDGAGYVLFASGGGVYDARPGSLDWLTSGVAAAVGASRVLAVECNDALRCATVVLSQADGSRRVIGPGFSPPDAPGAIAPGGSHAAVVTRNAAGTPRVQLVDLTSGRLTTVRVPVSESSYGGELAWSPDGGTLFVVDARGRVRVVDPATGAARALGVNLPPLTQIAVRPAVG